MAHDSEEVLCGKLMIWHMTGKRIFAHDSVWQIDDMAHDSEEVLCGKLMIWHMTGKRFCVAN